MMTLSEIEDSASNFGSMVEAQISLQDCAFQMQRAQPKHAEFWRWTWEQIRLGKPLSPCLRTKWPESYVSAVRAGEEAGNLEEVFERIVEVVQGQKEVQAAIKELLYPLGIVSIGLFVFCFFMVKVMPALTGMLGGGANKSFFNKLSGQMLNIYANHLITVGLIAAALIGAIIMLVRDPVNRERLVDLCLKLPKIGEAYREVYFGQWAYFMAMLANAGFPTPTALRMSADVLPGSLKAGVELMAREIASKGLSDSTNPDKLPLDDPRREWPYYISSAFGIAQQTGLISKELQRVAKPLRKRGLAKIKKYLAGINIIAIFVSGSVLMAPIGSYYIELGKVLERSIRGL